MAGEIIHEENLSEAIPSSPCLLGGSIVPVRRRTRLRKGDPV